ncbi:MAG TPA: alpha/beta hydrolase [Acidimicrobiales bacterium]|nr:alpha/beta hydrolase [Acidimicrobiales bacterium]
MGEHTFTDPDGVEVFYRSWPRDGAKGVVVIAHGASEHSGRYDRFARALNDAGYAAYGIDHRGHGRTSASTGVGLAGPGGGARMIDDLHELVERAARENGDLPVILFGHSMGSMIAQAYVQTYGSGLAGYVLSGCPGPNPDVEAMKAGLQAAVDAGQGDAPLGGMLSAFNEAFEHRTGFEWLSRDAAEVDKYVADPYCGDNHPLTAGFFNDLIGLSAPAMEPDGIARIPQLPVLMITGEMDPAAGMGASARELEKRLRDAGLDVTAHYYADARHELLNETNRDAVTADVIAWLDGVISR